MTEVQTRPVPPRLHASVLNFDAKGHPHKPGTVVVHPEGCYRVETTGALRRVQVLEEIKGQVRYTQIRKLTKPEKKALKRSRARARADLAAAALRVSRRVMAEATHG